MILALFIKRKKAMDDYPSPGRLCTATGHLIRANLT